MLFIGNLIIYKYNRSDHERGVKNNCIQIYDVVCRYVDNRLIT